MINHRVMSDLHLEFMREAEYQSFLDKLFSTSSKEETLILAGDICPVVLGDRLRHFLKRCVAGFSKVIYVPGNHEFYGSSSITRGLAALKWMCNEIGVSFLYNRTHNTVVGTTLWFLSPTPEAIANKDRLNDFNHIGGFTVDEGTAQAFLAYDFLREEGINHPIWILHHAPSLNCLQRRYRETNDSLNSFYYTNIERLVMAYKPKYVIHGHTHQTYKMTVGDTTIMCNAKGYGEQNMDFDMEFGFKI